VGIGDVCRITTSYALWGKARGLVDYTSRKRVHAALSAGGLCGEWPTIGRSSRAEAQAISDVDIFNFAPNLEYLERSITIGV
jgi:hypothetical protein